VNDGISEVYVMPTYGKGGSDAHIVSMRKAGGEWWHFVGNVLQRKATTLESLLPLAPALWQELAECEGWWKRAEDAEANLAEVEMLSAQPPRDEIDRPWTREHERNVWHYDGKDGMMLCGIIIAGSPRVMANEFAFAVRKCPTCRRGAP
jgi:hypothetical protein